MSATLPDLECAVCGGQAMGVYQVSLALPMSLPYCGGCISNGREAWSVLVGQVYMLIMDAPDFEEIDLPEPITVQGVRANLAPWAVDTIERSLVFHGKTWEDVLADATEDVERLRERTDG